MSILETVLVILISIWSVIFIIIAIALVIILKELKKAMDRVNSILESTENVASGVETGVGLASRGLSALFASKKTLPKVREVSKKTSKKIP